LSDAPTTDADGLGDLLRAQPARLPPQAEQVTLDWVGAVCHGGMIFAREGDGAYWRNEV
jgi:hypothetical protein